MFMIQGQSGACCNAPSLDEAIIVAKCLAERVVIVGAGYEIVGTFGVDSVKGGALPCGTEYSWKKRRD